MDRRKKLRRVVHSAGHIGLENDEIGKDIMIRDYDIMSVFMMPMKMLPLGKSSQKEKRKMLPFFKIIKNRTGKSSQN